MFADCYRTSGLFVTESDCNIIKLLVSGTTVTLGIVVGGDCPRGQLSIHYPGGCCPDAKFLVKRF